MRICRARSETTGSEQRRLSKKVVPLLFFIEKPLGSSRPLFNQVFLFHRKITF